MSTLKVESLRHIDADSDALVLSSNGTITFNGTLVGATDSAQVQAQIDSAAVKLTTNQTVAGIKTFSDSAQFNSSVNFGGTVNERAVDSGVSIGIQNGTPRIVFHDPNGTGNHNWEIDNSNGTLRFFKPGVAKAQIDSDGNVGIGNVAPDALLDVRNGTTYTSPDDFLAKVQQNTNATGKNGLSVMNAWAATNSTIFECAMGWDGAATGYYPVVTVDGIGRAIFKPERSEKVRIDTDGIKFNGDTAAANALDDYEEGTWTPTLEYGSCTITGATYTKIGRMVYAEAQLTAFSDRSTAAAVKVGGLPYNSSSTTRAGNVSLSRYINRSGDAAVSYLGGSRNYMHFYSIVANADYQQVYHSHLSSSSSNFYISIVYETV